jgi:hypothetical protein
VRKLLASVLLVAACHEGGEDTLRQVKAQYAALVQVRTPPQSRDFDALLRSLESIPQGSRARAEGDRLRQAIETARGGAIPRPLAVAAAPLPDLGVPQLQAQLESTRAECERLARQLGGKEGEARTLQLDLIDACRRRGDELFDQIEHSQHPVEAAHRADDGGPP